MKKLNFRKPVFFIMCISLGITVNVLCSIFARNSFIPLYLDSIMTFAVTAACGLWGGILCALLSNIVLWIFYNTALPFTVCHILTAITVWLTIKCSKNHELTFEVFLWAGLWTALVNTISGNIIISLLTSSSTSPNADNSVQCIFLAIPNLNFAVYFSGLISNLTDKMISAALSYVMFKGISRLGIFFQIKAKKSEAQ